MEEDTIILLYEEVSKIRQLVEYLARNELREALERVATTDERKRLWALCNGENSTKEIAQKINVSIRSVQHVVKMLQESDLVISEKRGYPKRRFDYVPSEWEIDVEGG